VRESLRQIEACHHVNLIYNKTQSFTSSDPYAYYDQG
jgi:protein-tyrosine kinase